MRLSHLPLACQQWSLTALEQVAHRLGRRTGPAHLRLGERGEFEALFFLRRQGYVVVERRWRTPDLNGDLDLVAWEGEFLCFVEVKARSERDLTPASSAIDDRKRAMLRNMARAYLRALPGTTAAAPPIRFDVVSIYFEPGKPQYELVRAAFPFLPPERRSEQTRYGV